MAEEKLIQNDILEYLQGLNIGLFWQNDSFPIKGRRRKNRYRMNGVADILGCIDGEFVAIEVKSSTGRLSADQRDFASALKRAGGFFLVARSVEDVIQFLNRRGI